MFLLFFILAGIGITSIIVDSEFFRGTKEKFTNYVNGKSEKFEDEKSMDKKTRFLRKINYMLYCYQCMGFWVGMLLGILVPPMFFDGWGKILEIFMCGGLISFTSQLGMALFNYFNVDYSTKS